MMDLYKEIQQTDLVEIENLLDMVLRRYEELFPDWEISTVSVRKSRDRNEQLDRMIAMLQRMKSLP